jgi:hypothetical protein
VAGIFFALPGEFLCRINSLLNLEAAISTIFATFWKDF